MDSTCFLAFNFSIASTSASEPAGSACADISATGEGKNSIGTQTYEIISLSTADGKQHGQQVKINK